MDESTLKTDLCALLDDMSDTMASVRITIKALRETASAEAVVMRNGISLLSLKHQTLLSYVQSLLLLSARRVLGHTLSERSPSSSFDFSDRPARGSSAGDLVDAMLEGRLVLEKIKILETRMKYQIEKLVKVAEEPAEKQVDAADDPLAFRPNPQNFADGDEDENEEANDRTDTEQQAKKSDGIYRPPRLAPVPYTVTSGQKSKRDRDRLPVPTALSSLVDADPSLPHLESTSGLGNTPSMASGRAKYLKRLEQYEEDNFTRVVMKKKDAKRRLRDEEDLALGGTLSTSGPGRRRRGGFEDEFGDILKSAERTGRGDGLEMGDGYDELRKRGKKRSVLERSRGRLSSGDVDEGFEEGSEGGRRKRTRFEEQTRKVAKANRKQSRSRAR